MDKNFLYVATFKMTTRTLNIDTEDGEESEWQEMCETWSPRIFATYDAAEKYARKFYAGYEECTYEYGSIRTYENKDGKCDIDVFLRSKCHSESEEREMVEELTIRPLEVTKDSDVDPWDDVIDFQVG